MDALTEIFECHQEYSRLIDQIHRDRTENPVLMEILRSSEEQLQNLAMSMGYELVKDYGIIDEYAYLDAHVNDGILTVSVWPLEEEYNHITCFEFDTGGLVSMRRFLNPYSSDPKVMMMG